MFSKCTDQWNPLLIISLLYFLTTTCSYLMAKKSCGWNLAVPFLQTISFRNLQYLYSLRLKHWFSPLFYYVSSIYCLARTSPCSSLNKEYLAISTNIHYLLLFIVKTINFIRASPKEGTICKIIFLILHIAPLILQAWPLIPSDWL